LIQHALFSDFIHPQILDVLVDDQVIPVDKADQAKARFAKLHSALFEAMSREKELLDNAKQLKRKLDVRAGWWRARAGMRMQAKADGLACKTRGEPMQALQHCSQLAAVLA
jgi:hypothetical protein